MNAPTAGTPQSLPSAPQAEHGQHGLYVSDMSVRVANRHHKEAAFATRKPRTYQASPPLASPGKANQQRRRQRWEVGRAA